jgi:hypothetical protein
MPTVALFKRLYIQVPGWGKASALKPSPCSHWENGPAAGILFSFTLFCSYHLNLESEIRATACINYISVSESLVYAPSRQNVLLRAARGPTTEIAQRRENKQNATKHTFSYTRNNRLHGGPPIVYAHCSSADLRDLHSGKRYACSCSL